MATTTGPTTPAFDDKAYEDGKHRRYTLLFAVNGGAFAVAKLLGEKGAVGVGKLTMDHLALGMILFTAVMGVGIAFFGVEMGRVAPAVQKGAILWGGAFAVPGWLVLGALCVLIGLGWHLAAGGDQGRARTEGDATQGDVRELIRVNEEINKEENLGNVKELDKFLATEFAFQRRDEKIV